jgi:hypothetical protein
MLFQGPINVAHRRIKQTSGKIYYCVDQSNHPPSVTFEPGGLHAGKVLIPSTVWTAATERDARLPYQAIVRVIRKHYVKMQLWYVGPEALLLLSRGRVRFADDGGTIPELDLKWDERRTPPEPGPPPVQRCPLIRDLYPPVLFDPAWQASNGGAVQKLARSIAEHEHFEDLPILGDALEEAGCTDRSVLDHCRHGSEHVRDCWVIQLLMGNG